jgi:cyclic beta-1,2-glucan synthetase
MRSSVAVDDITEPQPSRSIELLGIERLEEHARRLAALFTVGRRPQNRGRTHLRRLSSNMRALRATYRALSVDASRGEPASPATEWLLDNFHVATEAARDIARDLPPSFFRRLPTIVADEF